MRTLSEMRTLYYTQQSQFSDKDYIDCLRRTLQIMGQPTPGKDKKEEKDVVEFPLLEKLHNKITKRLSYFKANECLNLMRAINQTVKLELTHEAFFKECIMGLPLESLTDLPINKLTALSINYHLIKNNKRLQLIENKELEVILL